MAKFWRSDENPSREVDDCFVATGTALLIAGLVSAGTTTAVGLYGQHQAGQANDKALDLSTQANREQLDYLKTKEAQDQANFDKTFDENRRQWQSTQDQNYDIWRTREEQFDPYRRSSLSANNTLADLIGLDRATALPASMPPRRGATSEGPAGNADATMFLKTLLDQGTDPQDAITQTNTKFKLGDGVSAKYYGPEAHHGIATIGLPDAYFALTDGRWNVTQRGGGGGPAPRVSAQPVARSAPLSSLMASGPAGVGNPSATPSTNTLSNLVRTAAPRPMDAMTLYGLMNQYRQAAPTPVWT